MDEKTNFLDSLEKAVDPSLTEKSSDVQPQQSNKNIITETKEEVRTTGIEKKSKVFSMVNTIFTTPLLEPILFCISLIISVPAIIKSASNRETFHLIAGMFLQITIIVIFLISLQIKTSQDKESNTK